MPWPSWKGCGIFSLHKLTMFSPSEYLTNLQQAALLNALFVPVTSLSSSTKKVAAQTPVIATIPYLPPIEAVNQCNDIINYFITKSNLSKVTLGVAALVITTLVIIHYGRKHGKHVFAWFRQNYQQLITTIKRKLLKQPIYLLPSSTSFVIL